jgi:hypothetical protein
MTKSDFSAEDCEKNFALAIALGKFIYSLTRHVLKTEHDRLNPTHDDLKDLDLEGVLETTYTKKNGEHGVLLVCLTSADNDAIRGLVRQYGDSIDSDTQFPHEEFNKFIQDHVVR